MIHKHSVLSDNTAHNRITELFHVGDYNQYGIRIITCVAEDEAYFVSSMPPQYQTMFGIKYNRTSEYKTGGCDGFKLSYRGIVMIGSTRGFQSITEFTETLSIIKQGIDELYPYGGTI